MDENYEPLGDVGEAAVPPPPGLPQPPPAPPPDAPPVAPMSPALPPTSHGPAGPAALPPADGTPPAPHAPSSSPGVQPPCNTFDMDADAYAQLPNGKQGSAKNKSGNKMGANAQTDESGFGGIILERLRSRNEAQLQCMIVSLAIFCSLTVVLIAAIVFLITRTKLFL